MSLLRKLLGPKEKKSNDSDAAMEGAAPEETGEMSLTFYHGDEKKAPKVSEDRSTVTLYLKKAAVVKGPGAGSYLHDVDIVIPTDSLSYLARVGLYECSLEVFIEDRARPHSVLHAKGKLVKDGVFSARTGACSNIST